MKNLYKLYKYSGPTLFELVLKIFYISIKYLYSCETLYLSDMVLIHLC